MLRSIGAQIEATTNNDACRDLSGKRLRDVKCEKLLKEWADKKSKEKDDRKERKRQRIERILEGPSRIKAEDNTYISETPSGPDNSLILGWLRSSPSAGGAVVMIRKMHSVVCARTNAHSLSIYLL
eukprot:sb/3475568/